MVSNLVTIELILKRTLVFVLILNGLTVNARPTSDSSIHKSMSLYFDWSGQNVYPSLNFEYTRLLNKKIGIGANAGTLFSLVADDFASSSGSNFSFFFLRKQNHTSFEAGLGYGHCKTKSFTLEFYESGIINNVFIEHRFKSSKNISHSFAFAKLGVRQYTKNHRFYFRANVLLIYGLKQTIYPIKGSYFPEKINFQNKPVLFFSNLFSPWFGISTGITLGKAKK